MCCREAGGACAARRSERESQCESRSRVHSRARARAGDPSECGYVTPMLGRSIDAKAANPGGRGMCFGSCSEPKEGIFQDVSWFKSDWHRDIRRPGRHLAGCAGSSPQRTTLATGKHDGKQGRYATRDARGKGKEVTGVRQTRASEPPDWIRQARHQPCREGVPASVAPGPCESRLRLLPPPARPPRAAPCFRRVSCVGG